VYINLIDQKEPTLNFKVQDSELKINNSNAIKYFKKIVLPSADELKKHKEYLKHSLKKNFFS
jgi:DNA polymerase-3 subunit epsilon